MARRRDRENGLGSEGRGDQIGIPMPAKRSDQIALPSTTLAAGAASWVTSAAIDVAKVRKLHFYITYTASGAGGKWGLLPEMHGGVRGDDGKAMSNAWTPLGHVDPGAPSVVDLASVPTDSPTGGANFAEVVIRPTLYAGEPSDGGETTVTVVTVDVESAQEVRVSMAELGAGTGTMEVRYTKSV